MSPSKSITHNRYARELWWIFAAILGLRVVAMIFMPLADTSEPRYAEIARLMYVSGDWITPWFDTQVPFWGKPPLTFWVEALSFRLFGVGEFAARLPSFLATLLTLALIYQFAKAYFDERTGQWAVVIYASTALGFTVTGAVLTDPFLVLSTTWAVTAFALARYDLRRWRYGAFLAVALGLLAKGPLVLVIVFGALLPCLIVFRDERRRARKLPWISGILLVIALSMPWYILAELKTPGFMGYFLMGEHLLRFLDSGWTGDLYGSAHQEPHGMIWIFALLAIFPWSFVLAAALVKRLAQNYITRIPVIEADYATTLLLCWGAWPLIFFTASGNILWTYVLPSLPALSIIIARINVGESPLVGRKMGWVLSAFMPILIAGASVIVSLRPELVNTEKALVAYADEHSRPKSRLAFVQRIPFSARFYSGNQVDLVSLEDLSSFAGTGRFIAMPKEMLAVSENTLHAHFERYFHSKRYVLTTVPALENHRKFK